MEGREETCGYPSNMFTLEMDFSYGMDTILKKHLQSFRIFLPFPAPFS